ncbi:MAG: hypothetical protein H0X58_01040 [Acidimicrobiia bacterium]|nr:hypothetical protein [Acidimicrobiia bacterium]
MHLRRVAVIALAALVVTMALATQPSPAAAATVLEVDAGYAGSYRPGAPVPVRVRIVADRLLRGELEVQVSSNFGDAVTVAVPVEAPGGTVKEVVVVAPTEAGSNRTEVRAVLRQDGSEVARGSAVVQSTADQELVGLLAGVLAGREPPGAAPLAIDAGTARFSALGPAELGAAPASLAALDVVGAAPDDLLSLDDGAREGVLAWVGAGGFLLVDTPTGEEIAGLPAEWQPAGRGRARAGLGEVRVTDGAMAAGNWAGLVEPTPVVTGQGGHFFGGVTLDGALATDAGLRIPRLGWLVGFLGVYVLVAVPLTLTILRRRGRGELGWVVLPVVALVFTAASYGAGREARGGTTAAHATVVHVTDGGALATTSVGIVSANGGRVEVDYPRRWTPAGRSMSSGGPPVQLRAALGSDGTAISQELDVGQFGVHRATGPVSLEGRLEVTATATGATTLEGTIRNTFPFALEEVAVLQDQSGAALGRLEAGEVQTWTFGLDVGGDPFPGAAGRAWPAASGFNSMPDPDSVVAFPLWSEFEAAAGADVLAPGTVVAAGWTREYEPPFDVPRSSVSGRTLMVGTGSVASGESGPVGPAVETTLVRGPFSNGGMFDDTAPIVFRLALPPATAGTAAVEPARLVVSAPEVLALETWSDGSWQELTGGVAAGQDGRQASDVMVVGPGQHFGPTAEHTLPPAALDAGVVWVRARTAGFGFIDPYTLASSTLITLKAAP